MEGRLITEMSTAAVSAAVTRRLVVTDSRVLETTVFKSVGLAVEDVATARLVYEATRQRG